MQKENAAAEEGHLREAVLIGRLGLVHAWGVRMGQGHSTMDMVRRYLTLAQAAMEAAHRLGSPVANWGL